MKEWVHAADRVERAEKVSSWTQWTCEETAAYAAIDRRLFSRLRGYTEAEIGEFEHFMTLSNQLNIQMGDEDYCFAITFEIKKIVTTPSSTRSTPFFLKFRRQHPHGGRLVPTMPL